MRYQNKLINLDMKLVKALYAVGDIHGNFRTFADDLVNSCKVRDCCVIVCGDIGLGFSSKNKELEEFKKMETLFAPRNIFVVFFRGNHDDPAWYEYTDDEFAKDFPHVIIAEDFTIVEHNNDDYPYKVLLWGGGISIDRTMRIPMQSYWPNEPILPLPAEFAEDKEINCVCSHVAPDFCLPVNTANLTQWFRIDPVLEKDLKEERETMGVGAHKLWNANKSTLSIWVYGHYHEIYYNSPRMNEEIAKLWNMRFIGLDMLRVNSYERDGYNVDNYNIFNRPHKNHLIQIMRF